MADVLDIENSEEFEVDEDGERTYTISSDSCLLHLRCIYQINA